MGQTDYVWSHGTYEVGGFITYLYNRIGFSWHSSNSSTIILESIFQKMPRLRLKSNNTEFFIGTSAQQQEVDREGRFKIAHLLSEGESDYAVLYL